MLSVELLARKCWQGWLVGLLNQVLWITLIITRELYGLLPLSCWLVVRYSFAMWRWRQQSLASQAVAEPLS